ncbi:MAG: Fic family protein [Candidatus Woesearchaeota archaeon]
MIKLTIKTIKGKKYNYLEKTIRIGKKVRKVSKYIGTDENIKKKKIEKLKEIFRKELFERTMKIRVNIITENIDRFEYPLSSEDIKKIEEMNFKHKEIMSNLHPKDIEDLNKRFIANYVFESNALEGNSLTLKNINEIIFENRISKGKDLREIYDAQNSYNLFLYLQKIREEISDKLIIKIHKLLMDKIDDRLGYRKIPIFLIGKPNTKLSKADNVQKDMDNLLKWYKDNENKLYTLELAFKFHAKFEKIHPFCDGNGRVGRFLLNYILIRKGYFPIIIRKTTRNSYLKALEAADRDKWIVLMRFALKHYKDTFRKFFEVYYKYGKKD